MNGVNRVLCFWLCLYVCISNFSETKHTNCFHVGTARPKEQVNQFYKDLYHTLDTKEKILRFQQYHFQ